MIHKTAIIDSKAELGADVEIGPYVCVEAGASIGDGCVIGPHVSIFKNTSIGSGCKIHAGAVLGDVPQDLGFTGCDTYANIGSSCTIREGVTVHRGVEEGSVTELGDNCFLMANSHCAHNVKLGNNVILANGVLLAGHVHVGKKAFLGGNAAIHQFVKIGRLAMIGGASGVSQDVPPFCMIKPADFNKIAGLNTVGMRRAGITAEERMDVKRAFKLLYRSGLNIKDAGKQIKEAFSIGPASEFSDFIDQSTRGICGV